MPSIASLLAALDEREIARRVGLPHDEAREHYRLQRNTVRDFQEFSEILGDYYAHHYGRCIAQGGTLPRPEAEGRAKEIVENYYQRRMNADLAAACSNAQDGLEGGMGGILNIIANALKEESVERYIRHVFDQHVAPNVWNDQVEIVRQFIAHCGMQLSTRVRAEDAERHARDYQQLIRSYVDALRATSSMFRRLQ
jgi:hypothetical protein